MVRAVAVMGGDGLNAGREHGALPHRMGDAAELRCQAWGGPRASKRKWSNAAGSIAANDQGKCRTTEIGGTTAGEVGMTSVLARLMLAQIAQKSSTRPVGFF